MLNIRLTTIVVASIVLHQALSAGAAEAQPDSGLPVVEANDNRTPAGVLKGGVLLLELRAGKGVWNPRGQGAAPLQIEALGEPTGPLTAPAPLIRVPEGTEIAATISNELPHALRVFGLCERGGAACPPLDVPAREVRNLRFRSGPAGTYHYWATTTGMPQAFRAADDTQLSGGFIVDAPGVLPEDERVLVITEWTSLTRTQLVELLSEADPGAAFLKLRPEALFLINGKSWPHTERLRYEVGAPVRWRVINLSTQIHPMHLHGFYFNVESSGDGTRDRMFASEHRPHVVTQVMAPGSTMIITWTPERTGNWLFHCHVMTHVSPVLHVDGSERAHDSHSADHHPGAGMTGMVLGITVHGRDTPSTVPERSIAPQRRLTLTMEADPARFGDAPAYGFRLTDAAVVEQAGNPDSISPVPVPGPILVLERGAPVEITLVNRLPEATAIHWHGMELDSYYDGAHGWSGNGEQVTPMVEPGGTFVVRFTPPRTGTFMYHTHLHDRRQLTSGLYGAMVVVEPSVAFDAATDHVVVLGRGGPQLGSPVVLNNERELQLEWKAGERHRLRLINITPDDILSVSLQSNQGPVLWRPLTKDGTPLPPERSVAGPGGQIIGVGETYDFEYQAPPGRRTLWLEVRSTGGKWQTQGRIIIR